jgi:hypothetical protein
MTLKNDDELDRELNAALAKYTAVEPRPGLEERVLSNLRSAPAEALGRAWWRWSLAAAVAAMVVVGLALAWRSGKPSRPAVASHPSSMTQGTPEDVTQVVSSRRGNETRPHHVHAPRTIRRSPPPVVVAAVPKLEQFPSPQPLTEEERILADYVRHFHDQAVQIARVTNAEVQRDRMEVLGPPQDAARFTEREPVMSR